jgi:D-sedoheptulose 7-phosphate isomerase
MTTVAAASVVQQHFARSTDATMRFFDVEARAVADCCRQMAERFTRGASLLVVGEGAQASDAQHVAVEFVHPIIVGKRALPALALTSDIGVFTASGHRAPLDSFVAPLQALARPVDIALGLSAARVEPSISVAIMAARERGLLTVLITGPSAAQTRPIADIELRVDDANRLVVQEVSETIYHVLWELVHVFFEREDGRQLFAYLPQPSGTKPLSDLVAEVQDSILQKARDVCALRTRMHQLCGVRIADAGRAIADRMRRGGRLLAFGNGGSATDAQDAAADCLAPPNAEWQRLPAIALPNDIGVVTAIGNDVGFDHVFSRQVIAFGGANDVALGFSTSGASRNVLAAMAEAKSRGLLTVAMSGGDGGALARPGAVDYCFTAPSDHLPRIQEAHATTWHALLAVVQDQLQS